MAWWNLARRPDPTAELKQQVDSLSATVARLAAPGEAQISNVKLSELTGWDELSAGIRRATGLHSVTPESALRSSAVYACVRLIAGTIAALPLRVYRKKSFSEREVANDHPALPLLATEPNATLSAMMFWETVIWHLLLRGNGYAVIRRKRNGQPTAIELFSPGCATAEMKRIGGLPRLIYHASNDEGLKTYDQDDILHFPCFGWNGVQSFTPISYAGQNSVGISLAADEHSAAFYGNGARTDLAILYPKRVTQEQARLIQDVWTRTHGGPDASNWRVPAILGDDAKVEQIAMTSEDAQLLEARKFQVVDIARMFGVPPHLIGETEKSTSWGSGIEEQTRGFLVFTLMSHIERIEQEINRKLIRSPEFFAEFDVDGLQRADSKTRSETYKSAVGGTQAPGWLTVNEIRALENRPPIEGGDALYRPAPAKAAPAGQPAEQP